MTKNESEKRYVVTMPQPNSCHSFSVSHDDTTRIQHFNYSDVPRHHIVLRFLYFLFSLSPSSLRKRITDMIRGHSGRKQSINLEVPQQFYLCSSSPESSDNESDMRISVPAKRSTSLRHRAASPVATAAVGDVNVVAPWDSPNT